MPARVDYDVGEDEEDKPPTLELGRDRRALLLSVAGLRAEQPTSRPAVISNGPRNGAGGVVRDAFGVCYRPMERAWLIVEESTDEDAGTLVRPFPPYTDWGALHTPRPR
eukprot:1374913-Prymnesium_polylepis.1